MLERFCKAIIEEDTNTIDALLQEEPALIKEAFESDNPIFTDAAAEEKFKALDHICAHRLFNTLDHIEQYAIYRQIVEGCSRLGKTLDYKNASDRPRLTLICKKSISYNRKIQDKADKDLSKLGKNYSLLGKIYSESSDITTKEVKEAWEQEISYHNKIKVKSDADLHNLASACSRLAVSFSQSQDFSRALSLLKEAKEFYQAITDVKNKSPELEKKIEFNLRLVHREILDQEARKWACESLVVDNPNQEDSLYLAIEDQLKLQGPEKQIPFSLTDFQSVYLDNDNVISAFRSSLSAEFNNYIDKLIKERILTKELALHIVRVSRFLNMNLVIIRSDGAQPIIIKQAQPQGTLYLGLNMMQGFLSLHRRSDWSPHRSIQDYISCAPIGHSPKKSPSLVSGSNVPKSSKNILFASMPTLPLEREVKEGSQPIGPGKTEILKIVESVLPLVTPGKSSNRKRLFDHSTVDPESIQQKDPDAGDRDKEDSNKQIKMGHTPFTFTSTSTLPTIFPPPSFSVTPAKSAFHRVLTTIQEQVDTQEKSKGITVSN